SRGRFPYFMLDVAEPWESYSAAKFVEAARPLVEKSAGPMILVAGAFLYLRALMEGLVEGPSADEELRSRLQGRAAAEGAAALHAGLARVDAVAASRIHPNDLRRIVRALEVFELPGSPISALQTQWSAEHPAMEAVYIGIR